MVEDHGSYAKEISLTNEAKIKNADISLRGKGIRVWTCIESLRASWHPYLCISVIVVGPAFSVYLSCNQNVLSEITCHTRMLGVVT